MNPALAGTWEMIRAELGGEQSPELIALRIELEFAANAYTVRFGGQIADRGTVEAHSPAAFTLTSTDGPNRGRVIPCLYQLAGDRLRICFGMDGSKPENYSTAKSSNYLATYRRTEPPHKFAAE
mgnify:CR=1 FL=1